MNKYALGLLLTVFAGGVAFCNIGSASFIQQEIAENIKSVSGGSQTAMTETKEKLFWTKGEIVSVEADGIIVKGEGTYPLVKVLVQSVKKTTLIPSAEMTGSNRHNLGVNVNLQEKITNQGTVIIDASNGRMLSSKKLAIGQKVKVYYTGNATRSYPPQTQGKAIMLITREDKAAHYYVVDSVELSADRKYVTVTDVNNELIATIPGKACSAYRNIKPGTRLLLWYDLMTMSLPAKTNAVKARIIE